MVGATLAPLSPTGGETMKAYAAMTLEVDVVSPGVSVQAAHRLMERKHVHHLPVVQDGKLVGMLSDRDLLRHPDRHTTCGEAMTLNPITCLPGAPVGAVAELMLRYRIHSVPVVDAGGVLAGLVTSSDLLALLVQRQEAELLPFDYQLRIVDSDAAAA
jgi:acetoin utilization protein AcuB